MESVYLKTLVEVVRTGSLSRAAELLHVTQPAVSRRIKFMEDQYGCELLDRSGPRLRATDAGRLVYDKARTLLEIEADLVSGLLHLDGKVRVALSCTPSFGIAHLPVILREFMLACGDHADLKFIFNTPDQMVQGLREGLFEVAVMEMCERFDLTPYSAFALPGDEMVFASAPELAVPLADTDLRTLFGIPLFTRREGCCSRMMLENNLACLGHDLQEFQKVIAFDDIHVIVKAVLAGEGLAFLSRDVLEDHLASGRLRAHHVPGFTHARERALVLGDTALLSAPLRLFVREVFRHFGLPEPATFGDNRRAADASLPGVSRNRPKATPALVAPVSSAAGSACPPRVRKTIPGRRRRSPASARG